MEYYVKLAGKPTKSRLFEWPQFWEHLSNLKKKSKELSKHSGYFFRVPNITGVPSLIWNSRVQILEKNSIMFYDFLNQTSLNPNWHDL